MEIETRTFWGGGCWFIALDVFVLGDFFSSFDSRHHQEPHDMEPEADRPGLKAMRLTCALSGEKEWSKWDRNWVLVRNVMERAQNILCRRHLERTTARTGASITGIIQRMSF